MITPSAINDRLAAPGHRMSPEISRIFMRQRRNRNRHNGLKLKTAMNYPFRIFYRKEFMKFRPWATIYGRITFRQGEDDQD
jgi:hypothetical protein